MESLWRKLNLACLIGSCVLAQAGETKNIALVPYAQDLVVLKDSSFESAKSDTILTAPYTVLYFGAGWCPNCRRFSPALVDAYDHQAVSAPRFEVVFLTMDKTAEGMLKFMKGEKMRWPALAFEKVAGAEGLRKSYSGHGIPCLSVIDQKGTVLLQSKSDQDAREVLDQLQVLLSGKPAK